MILHTETFLKVFFCILPWILNTNLFCVHATCGSRCAVIDKVIAVLFETGCFRFCCIDVIAGICASNYLTCAAEAAKDVAVPVKFAMPGKERQDSVRSGLNVRTWPKSYLFLFKGDGS